MSNRTLIAYYSMSGHTKALANELRDAVGADIEEIVEPHRRHGVTGVARALFDSLVHREPPIAPASKDPRQYDVLLLGAPVWGGRMAAPARSYARRYGATAQRVAFFCTEGGRGADSAFADLESLCGKRADATLVVDAAHLPPAAHQRDLASFASTVSLTRH
jgi:flavodoxin